MRTLKHRQIFMFGTIRKHSNWLWVFIIVVVSLSMVVFFSGDVQLGGGSSNTADYGSINGKPITHAEYVDALNEVRLSQFLSTRQWPGSDEASRNRLESETVSRVFLVQRMKEMGVKASDKAVALMVQEQLGDIPYDTFEKQFLQPEGLRAADYERFVRNQAGLRHLFFVAGVSGNLVLPSEAETLWRKENQEVSTQLAVFWATNYLDKVVITNGAIGSFYTNRMGFYRLPERQTLSYVEFSASNYFGDADKRLSQLTNLNEIVSEYYFRGRNGTNSWTDDKGNVLPEAAAKEKIKEEIRLSEAVLAARRAAAEFGNELMSHSEPNQAATLEKLAAAKNLPVKMTKPFDRMSGLEEFEEEVITPATEESPEETVRDLIRQKAFSLTDERPVLFNPIPGKRAVYLIARKGKVPSELQPLDKIKDKVTTDYRNYMALDLARKAGQAFHITLTNGLNAKKPFAEICAAEKVKTIDLPPFSAGTRSLTNIDQRVSLRLLQSVALDLEVGKTSPFLSAQPASEGGFIVYARSRPAIDEAKMKEELPRFVNQLRNFRQNDAFQQWFRKQVETAKVAGPKRETTIGAQN